MLNTLLKPVKELLSLFRKQNNVVKILLIIEYSKFSTVCHIWMTQTNLKILNLQL